jgi:hypothetical protein
MEQALLTRQIDVHECARRNALTNKPADLVLAAGSMGIVVDTFDGGGAFLVEFGSRGPHQCDWLGVLYASEIELMAMVAEAA